MKDKSRRDACPDGKDSAPPLIRENTKGKDHQDSQYKDFGDHRSHETLLITTQYVPLATHIPARNLATIKLTHYPRPEMISPLSGG
jgi:hypothetical protein